MSVIGPTIPPRQIERPRALLTRELPAPASLSSLVKVRRGAYHRLESHPPNSPAAERELAIVKLDAVARQLRSTFHFCRQSAAIVWGLPMWHRPGSVHVVQRHVPGQGGAGGIVRHRERIDSADVTEVHGLPVTTLRRTVIDCARLLSPIDGLVVVDAALRRGVSLDELSEELDRSGPGRGVVRARAVLDAADPDAGSPVESALRYHVLRHGLPRPRTRVAIPDHYGYRTVAIAWPQWRLAVELRQHTARRARDGFRASHLIPRTVARISETGRWTTVRLCLAELHDSDTVLEQIDPYIPSGPRTPRPGLEP